MPDIREPSQRHADSDTSPTPNHVATPLPRDFLLLLISHFEAQSDTQMLCTLALLDRHTNERVIPSLYRTVRLSNLQALVSFFGYYTGYRIKQSRKVSAGEDGAEVTPKTGHRHHRLVGCIRHLEVELRWGDMRNVDQDDVRAQWQRMVGKLQVERTLDVGFPQGLLQLDTLLIVTRGILPDDQSYSPSFRKLGELPQTLDFAFAFVLAKCCALHIRHIEIGSSATAATGASITPKIRLTKTVIGYETITRITRHKMSHGLISFDTPLWAYVPSLSQQLEGIHKIDSLRFRVFRSCDAEQIDDLLQAITERRGNSTSTSPKIPLLIVLHTKGCDNCNYSGNRVRSWSNSGTDLRLGLARNRGDIRLVHRKKVMTGEMWREWLERKLWENPNIGTEAWAEQQVCQCPPRRCAYSCHEL
jgi:hypothetical protein